MSDPDVIPGGLPPEADNKSLNRIALRAFGIIEGAVPGFIERAQQTACPSILERRHDAGATPFDVIRIAHAAGIAHLASKLGYATRIAEFEQLDVADYNRHLEAFLIEAASREAALESAAGGTGIHAAWYATLVSTARVLTRAAEREARSPGDCQLLEPTALGRAAHRELRAWELEVRTQSAVAQEALKEISASELADCWDFGYYLRACEMSLPVDARAALAP